MRLFCSAFMRTASSRIRDISSEVNSASVRQSRPEKGEAEHSGGQGSPCSRYRRLGCCLLYSLVNAASKGIERSPNLRSAYGERRRHADSRSAHEVDEDALIQTVLKDLPGKAGVAEIDPEQESFTPHLRAGDLLRKLLQCVLQHGPLETYFFEEGWIIHHA